MSYPKEIVVRRLINELDECKEYLGKDFKVNPEDIDFPYKIDMHLSNVMAYSEKDKLTSDHDFSIIITEEYGQSKPEVRWRSKIFHPNIMMPEDGGLVCIKMLNEWTYGMRLKSFLCSISTLITEPNPSNPFGTKSCLEAAEFFKNNSTVKYDVKTAESE